MKLIYLKNKPLVYFIDGNDKSVDNIRIINMHHLLKHISHQTDYLTEISNRTLFETVCLSILSLIRKYTRACMLT